VSTRREFLGGGVQLAAAATLGVWAPTATAAKSAEITTTDLGRDMWLLQGAGCNVLALKGPSGSLLVDGGYARESKALLKAAAGITGNRRSPR